NNPSSYTSLGESTPTNEKGGARGLVLGTGVAGLMDQHRFNTNEQPIETKFQDMSVNDPTFIGHSGRDITDIQSYDNTSNARDLNEDGLSYEKRARGSVGYNRPNEYSAFPTETEKSDPTGNILGDNNATYNAAHNQRMPGDFPEEHTYISRDNHPTSFGGIMEKVKGTIKESVGHMVGNERMALEGEMEKQSGQVMLDSARGTKANQR
ncbi:hypothetical protein K7432_006386, partial [Basidiobolus ranarum]